MTEGMATAAFPPLVQRLEPLLHLTGPERASILDRLLTDAESLKLFAALDSELFVVGGSGPRSLAVVSALRGEGRTSIALLLAVLAAATDSSRRVLAIDADLAAPSLGTLLGVGGSTPGLAELFGGAASPSQCLHATPIPNLHVVRAGRAEARALAFSPSAFAALLEEVHDRFDLAVVDTAAAGEHRAVLPIAKLVGQALVVVRYGGPTREQVNQMIDDINRAGARIIGAVMNRREYVVPALFYGSR